MRPSYTRIATRRCTGSKVYHFYGSQFCSPSRPTTSNMFPTVSLCTTQRRARRNPRVRVGFALSRVPFINERMLLPMLVATAIYSWTAPQAAHAGAQRAKLGRPRAPISVSGVEASEDDEMERFVETVSSV